MPETAVVVGGGISGLVSAYKLANAGKKVTLLEVSDRLGGLIGAIEIAGLTIDSGAEAFSTIRNDTFEVIDALGLQDSVVSPAAAEARILADGETFKIPHGMFGIPSNLSDESVLAAIGSENVAVAQELDSKPWNLEQPGSLAELVGSRLGDAVLEKLVTPVIAGVHASQPALLGVESVAPGLFAKAKQLGSLTEAVHQLRSSSAKPGASVASLRGGMGKLVAALTQKLEALGVEIRLGVAAHKVAQLDTGYEVELAGEPTLLADYLVLATPPEVSARLLADFPALAQRLSRIVAVDVALAIVHIDDAKLNEEPFGSGVLIAPSETNIGAKASTHVSAKWQWVKDALPANQHIIRLSYGRDGVVPELDATLVETAKQDAAALYGVPVSSVKEVKLVAWPKSLIQPRNNHAGLLVEIAELQKSLPRFALVGAGLGGNGITGILAKVSNQIEQMGK